MQERCVSRQTASYMHCVEECDLPAGHQPPCHFVITSWKDKPVAAGTAPPSAPATPQCPACGSDVGALGTEFAYFICRACEGERYWTPDHKHPADSGLSWERGVMCSPWGNARKLLESLKQPVTVTACAAIVAASERTS